MVRLLMRLGSYLSAPACLLTGHRYAPFPEDVWAPLRYHRCGRELGL